MKSVTKQSFFVHGFMVLTLGIIGMSCALAAQLHGGEPDWSFNATIIEAWSCPNPCLMITIDMTSKDVKG